MERVREGRQEMKGNNVHSREKEEDWKSGNNVKESITWILFQHDVAFRKNSLNYIYLLYAIIHQNKCIQVERQRERKREREEGLWVSQE